LIKRNKVNDQPLTTFSRLADRFEYLELPLTGSGIADITLWKVIVEAKNEKAVRETINVNPHFGNLIVELR
jgi:hypothetical protein